MTALDEGAYRHNGEPVSPEGQECLIKRRRRGIERKRSEGRGGGGAREDKNLAGEAQGCLGFQAPFGRATTLLVQRVMKKMQSTRFIFIFAGTKRVDLT